ncbi:MAG: DUF5989 family protein [Planctomycetota bacterium]
MKRLRYLWRLLKEFGAYTWEYKTWWLIPVVGALLLLGLLTLAGQTSLANLYTLF